MTEMANVIAFPGRRRTFTVSVDDALYDDLVPTTDRAAAVVDGLVTRYLRASEMGDGQADFAVGAYQPTRPDCELLFDTLAGERFEQDASDQIYRDGVVVWDGTLAAFGVPRTDRYHCLKVGSEAALFFLARTDSGWAFEIRLTAPILALAREPRIRSGPLLPTMWLSLAASALDGANFDEGEGDGQGA